jgi:hypothetical protein
MLFQSYIHFDYLITYFQLQIDSLQFGYKKLHVRYK